MGLLSFTKMTFVSKKHEKDDVYSFYFHPHKKLHHKAGQHGLLILPHFRSGLSLKPFSLASAPEDIEVMIGTHVHASSTYKQALDDLKPGDIVRFYGPIRRFTLDKKVGQVVFLAQGIGITPFRSLLRHAHNQQLNIRSTLIHVERENHIYREETEQLSSVAHFPTDPEMFNACLLKTIQEQPEATYFLSGAPSFIKSVRSILLTQGITTQHIKQDSFLGYK